MNRKAILSVAVCVLASGCAPLGGYLTDRGNDLADCWKVQVGLGVGVDARVQATHWASTGVGIAGAQRWGLEGREVGGFHSSHAGLPVTLLKPLLFPSLKRIFRRFHWALGGRGDPFRNDRWWMIWITDECDMGPAGPLGEKPVVNRSSASMIAFDVLAIPACRERWNAVALHVDRRSRRRAIHALDVAIDATVVPLSVRFGVSPGEFADFLVGWAGVDPGQDDAASRASDAGG